MRKALWIIVLVLIVAGIWFWWGGKEGTPGEEMQESPQQQAGEQGPAGAAGINGSPNQGNLGQPASGQVQQPSNLVIGNNVALGTDSNDKLGTYLIAYNGMTVYTFTKDTGAVSSCYDTCAKNWPPYIVAKDDAITNLKAGVSGTVGTTVRTDGSLQLTYNGHPLYFYIKDTASGDTTGDGVNSAWYVVKP